MVEIDRNEGDLLAPLFAYSEETPILSYTQGCMGRGWADRKEKPRCGRIIVGDLCFLAGDTHLPEAEALAGNIPRDSNNGFLLMVPENEKWSELIEKHHPGKHERVFRYAMKKDTRFSVEKLKHYASRELPDGFQLVKMGRELYEQCRREPLEPPSLRDLCSQFTSAEDYLERGIGYAVLYHGRIIAGASAYTVYKEGIEIEIDTREEYQRRGFALVCGAKLILECLKEGRYPSWDAANEVSVRLAEKLGYELKEKYVTYMVEL